MNTYDIDVERFRRRVATASGVEAVGQHVCILTAFTLSPERRLTDGTLRASWGFLGFFCGLLCSPARPRVTPIQSPYLTPP